MALVSATSFTKVTASSSFSTFLIFFQFIKSFKEEMFDSNLMQIMKFIARIVVTPSVIFSNKLVSF